MWDSGSLSSITCHGDSVLFLTTALCTRPHYTPKGKAEARENFLSHTHRGQDTHPGNVGAGVLSTVTLNCPLLSVYLLLTVFRAPGRHIQSLYGQSLAGILRMPAV